MNASFSFSYWTFGWFLLYLFRIIPYSPKFIFMMEIIVISIPLLQMKDKAIKFFTINCIIKGVPLWILRNTKITIDDLWFSVFLFLSYLCWLYINDTSLLNVYTKIYDYYIGKNGEQMIGGYIYDYFHRAFISFYHSFYHLFKYKSRN